MAVGCGMVQAAVAERAALPAKLHLDPMVAVGVDDGAGWPMTLQIFGLSTAILSTV